MSSIIFLLLGITIAPVFSNSPIFEGRCPTADVDVIQNFNQTEFQGFWHIIERYEVPEFPLCARLRYTWNKELREYNQITKQKWRDPESESVGTQLIQSIVKEKEEFSNTGKYVHRSSFIHFQDYHFVDTDYENYAVLWTCLQRIGKHEQNLIVMAKNKFFDINSLESLNATLAKPPFNRSLLNAVDHKDPLCAHEFE